MAHQKDSRDSVERLSEAVTRLMEENTQLRKKIEDVEIVLRRRAPNAAGLSLKGAANVILNDRDAALARIQVFRDELKKALKKLAGGHVKEVMKEINHFLFHNQK